MKLFLASEKFYDLPDSKEATVLLIAAEDKESAFRNATFSVCPDEPRSVLTPMFDIWELGEFTPLPDILAELKEYPENVTGGVTILSGYEPVEYRENEAQYRKWLYAKHKEEAADHKMFAYYDELKKNRDDFFSFTEKKGWLRRDEEHLGFKIPVWVDPIWDQIIEVYAAEIYASRVWFERSN